MAASVQSRTGRAQGGGIGVRAIGPVGLPRGPIWGGAQDPIQGPILGVPSGGWSHRGGHRPIHRDPIYRSIQFDLVLLSIYIYGYIYIRYRVESSTTLRLVDLYVDLYIDLLHRSIQKIYIQYLSLYIPYIYIQREREIR